MIDRRQISHLMKYIPKEWDPSSFVVFLVSFCNFFLAAFLFLAPEGMIGWCGLQPYNNNNQGFTAKNGGYPDGELPLRWFICTIKSTTKESTDILFTFTLNLHFLWKKTIFFSVSELIGFTLHNGNSQITMVQVIRVFML